MSFKGTILLIGGGEYRGDDSPEKQRDDPTPDTPLNYLYKDPAKAKIAIITTGTAYPRESFEIYEKYLKAQGVQDVHLLDIDSRYLKDEQIQLAKEATAIFIGGGNQRKILEILAGTELEKIIAERLERDKDFILAGTSAGAMVICDLTIGDGYQKKNLIKGDVDIRDGMNLLPGIIVDTHFILSSRLARLTLSLLEHPDMLGIAIPENAGLMIKEGNYLEPVGSEMVIIMDPSHIEETNFDEAEPGDPVFAYGMGMHFLNQETVFSLNERKLIIRGEEKIRQKAKARTKEKEKL